MMQRKGWTADEDRALKYLHDDCKEIKWSVIAKRMAEEFNIPGKSGKQCRERYHNHLDSTINTQNWTAQEEEILLECQEKFGNKWAIISTYLIGRPDNTIKNHFYSKLRKALRKFNRTVLRLGLRNTSQVEMTTLYKIIEGLDQNTKPEPTTRLEVPTNFAVNQAQSILCSQIKNDLLHYDSYLSDISEQIQPQFILKLHDKIRCFERKNKTGSRRRPKSSDDEEQFKCLIPPKNRNENFKSLQGSENNSYSDYSSFNGGPQLSEMQAEEDPRISTRGRAKSSYEFNRKDKSAEDKRQSMGLKKQEYIAEVSNSLKNFPTTTEPSLNYSPRNAPLSELYEQMNEEVPCEPTENQMVDEETEVINMLYEESNFNMRVISPRMSTQEILQMQGVILFEPANRFFHSRIEEE